MDPEPQTLDPIACQQLYSCVHQEHPFPLFLGSPITLLRIWVAYISPVTGVVSRVISADLRGH